MLDIFSIFTKGGIVLLCLNNNYDKYEHSLNKMIKSSIIDERAYQSSFEQNSHVFKYRIDNQLDIIHAAGYKIFMNLPYVDLFLDDVKLRFSEQYKAEMTSNSYWNTDFESFRDILGQLLKNREDEFKSSLNVSRKMRTFEESEKSQKTLASLKQPKIQPDDKNSEKVSKGAKKIQKPDKKKTKRTWEECTAQPDVSLDFSNSPQDGEDLRLDPPLQLGNMKGDLSNLEVSSSEEEEPTTPSLLTKIYSTSKSILEGRIIKEADLEDASKAMKLHLMKKNVAVDVCENICSSVMAKLVGKRMSNFKTLKSKVKEAMYDSCLQILTPSRHIDVLRDAHRKRSEQRGPYSIVFCGVNGVGKSTSLSKVAFWLIENSYRVMIAACDTFRAGAVEQLKTHYKRMQAMYPPRDFGRGKLEECVSIFERGYGRDADGIARAAITEATNLGYDVVLIDTAGRMQNNDPLMKALSKLVHYNQPDLVLFVGEALVGNDGVDQLVKFDKSLEQFGSSTKSRNIDAIFITKLDTVDDQVGAALSMTYVAGQPILFVGTGQTYRDLKKLDARRVAQSLMKN